MRHQIRNPAGTGNQVSRRGFLRSAGGAVAVAGLPAGALAAMSAPGAAQATGHARPNAQDAVRLPPLHASTEAPEKPPAPFEADPQRTGYAVVGLGHLSVNEILPAFGHSHYSRVTALVSGDRAKAAKLAAQYGVKQSSIYSYHDYEKLAGNPEVQAIYIVLPNSMHAEYTERGAKLGKHILCEKPMATSSTDCQKMIDACKRAKVKLMIAYRQQYEPNNRAIVKLVREGSLGALKSFVATNAQNQGDPNQWRQKLALAGGGCLPDVGIYCLNAARFLSGEEPSEVTAFTYQPKDDPRFREVEETCAFTLRFPSGFIASCSSGYGAHRSQFMRLEGSLQWAEMEPSFAYHGLKLRLSRVEDERDVVVEPSIPDKDQFALEMDHFSLSVQQGREPHTPGEEGLQDQRVVEAIYQAARSGKTVTIAQPTGPTRGPAPVELSR